MKQLRYAVFVLGFVVMFALVGCAGNTQDLGALTPESEAGAGETVAETPIAEGGEATPETAGEMGPAEPTVAGEAVVAEPTTAAEAVAEPTVAGEAVVAEPTTVEATAAPTSAPTTAVVAATAAPTQAAVTSELTTPAEEGTSTDSQILTISADGNLSPSSISVDPGTRVSLTMVNLSSNVVLLMVNVGNASSSITIPAAAQTEDSTGLILTPQEMFVQFDQAGDYEITCSQGCSGSISIDVGGGAAAEPAAATPTE